MMADRFAHEMPFGAAVLPDCGVRFRLWAPVQEKVRIVLGDRDLVAAMTRSSDGWFERSLVEAAPGTHYRFELGDGTLVPDPASRAQARDVHGPSVVVAPRSYHWKRPEWRGRPWREAVIYEAHLGCFTPEGGFDSARRKLDHLVSLGVTALELMPIAAFEGQRNWGYDGVLPFAPHRSYGTPDELKQLIDEAHEHGLMMFLDVVYNHFGPSGNYLHLYAPHFFTERHHTPWGAAINFDGPDSRPVRNLLIHNALYWLEEYRFDGLRLDAVHAIADDSRPDFLTELAETVRARIGADRYVHLVLENDANACRRLRRDSRASPRHYAAQWNDDTHHAAHVLLTGETQGYYSDYAADPAAKLARALAEGFAYQGEASPHRGGAPRGEPSADLPTVAFMDFLQNHDQIGNRAFGGRLSSLTSEEALAAAHAILLLSPHIPMLFMGEEWGSETPFRFFCDFQGDLAKAVHEGRRREFARFPEFADPETRDLIPDPNLPETFEASRLEWRDLEQEAAQRRLRRAKTLLAIRAKEIAPRLGRCAGESARYEVRAGRAIRLSWELDDASRVSMLANLSDHSIGDLNWPAGQVICTAPENLAVCAIVQSLPPWSVVWMLAPRHDGAS